MDPLRTLFDLPYRRFPGPGMVQNRSKTWYFDPIRGLKIALWGPKSIDLVHFGPNLLIRYQI